MTARAFVIGHPIKHSRSPLIHNFWLHHYQLTGQYEAIDVAPESLADFIDQCRAGTFLGGNVTIPHKEKIFDLCDHVDEKARTIGAVNTLVCRDGKILGTNTDWLGFAANLDAKAPNWDKKADHALVLGAGGAARAIILALQERGYRHIHILNRSLERAQHLAQHFSASNQLSEHSIVRGYALSDFAQLAPKADIVINTSAIGMNGTSFEKETINLALLPAHALVTDIVYTPLQTPLLADAAALGLKTIDGLGMLLHQAVPGFEAWFGVKPEVTPALRALIEDSLGAA